MSESQSMLSDERKTVTVSILDKGGEVIQDASQLPAGWKVSFESSNPSVVGISVRPDGLTADLSSDDVGTSTITVSTTRGDGSHLQDSPDVTELEVKNAEPNAQNVTFSEALPEGSEGAEGVSRSLASAPKLSQAERAKQRFEEKASREPTLDEAAAERAAAREATRKAEEKAKASETAARSAGQKPGAGSFGPDAEADARAKAEAKARREREGR